MTGGRRKTTSSSPIKTGEEKMENVKKDEVIALNESSPDSEVKKLRGRWELACVLNFLNVFEPVIGGDLKLTADEIEMGLIMPNRSMAQLHIILLKGIPPVSKLLNGSDAWVTVLCKKLAMWWPWVAEGEIPLTAAKGEEISRYKELDPIRRLLMLKALCEIRADQNDSVSYINDSLKKGTEVSYFRKEKIGKDVSGTSYWYDGSTIIGYRLYREIKKTRLKTKPKGKGRLTLPAACIQWETLATNVEEFHEVVDELSSSKVAAKVAVGKTIANDAVPDVEKFHKKKQRSLKRKQRQEMLLLSGFRSSYAAGITRSCRSRRAISYTFDEYDRAIDEAIALTKKSKTIKEQRHEKKHLEQRKIASEGGSVMETKLEESYGEGGDPTDSETESDQLQEAHDNDDEDNDDDDEYGGTKEDDIANGSDSDLGTSDEERNLGKRNHAKHLVQKPVGSRWSERLAGGSRCMETKNLGTKNRLRQRPTRNSALDTIVSDSDDEVSEPTNSRMSEHENLSIVADSEEVSDC